MLFGRAKNCNIEVLVSNNRLGIVEEFKYLGLVVDNNLSFKLHVDHVIKAIASFSNLMWRRSRYIPDEHKKQLYFAFVQSHLIYLCNIWCHCPEYKMNELYVMQKKCIKAMMMFPLTTTSTYLFSQTFLPIRLMIALQKLCSCIR